MTDIATTPDITVETLTAQKAALEERVRILNTRAYRADRALEEFKEQVVQEAVDYLRDNGPCSTVDSILENLGLELPKKSVSFVVITRTTVTLTVASDQDPEDRDFLAGLVQIDSDGTVNINYSDVEDVDISDGELEDIQDIELTD